MMKYVCGCKFSDMYSAIRIQTWSFYAVIGNQICMGLNDVDDEEMYLGLPWTCCSTFGCCHVE